LIILDPLQRPLTFFVPANQNPTSGIIAELFRNLLLLYYNTTDLSVVLNKACSRPNWPESRLQRVKDVLETIVDIVNSEALSLAQVKQHHNFNLIIWLILDSNLIPGIQNIGKNVLAPLIPIPFVSGQNRADSASTFGHLVCHL